MAKTRFLNTSLLMMVVGFTVGLSISMFTIMLTGLQKKDFAPHMYSNIENIEMLNVIEKTTTKVAKNEIDFLKKIKSKSRCRNKKLIKSMKKSRKIIKILCLVVTSPSRHKTHAQHVFNTWARKCSKIYFITNTLKDVHWYDKKEKDVLHYQYKKVKPLLKSQTRNDVLTNKHKISRSSNDLNRYPTAKHNIAQIPENKIAKMLSQTNLINHKHNSSFHRESIEAHISEQIFQNLPSGEERLDLPLLEVPDTAPGREGLWNKTRYGFNHVYNNHLKDYDWFLKADDDTYIIMENLRHFLKYRNPKHKHYYGCHLNTIIDKGYMSGGAGYVLSQGAVAALVEEGLKNHTIKPTYGSEDVLMGFYLAASGVFPGDSRDSIGKPRFFPFLPGDVTTPDEQDSKYWYWNNIAYNHSLGLNCCSDSAISFHYVGVKMMYTLEFLLYHLKIH